MKVGIDADARLPLTADVVVVGGGIVGCFTALELARRGLRPVVLEKGRIGGEQSSRNWGYVRQQARDEAELPLMVAANRIWASLEDELGVSIDWAQRGNLRLVANEQDFQWYRDWAKLGNSLGVPTRLLGPDDIPELLPRARGEWHGAMFTPNDGQVDPGLATDAVASAAVAAGAGIFPGHCASAILARRGRVVGVATPAGTIASDRVVVAGGVWTRRLLSPLGLNLPLQWIRSTVAQTAPARDFPDIPAVWSPGVAFRRTGNGSILVGPVGRADVDAMPSSVNNVRQFMPTMAHNLKAFQVRVNRATLLDTRNRLSGRHRYSGWEPRANPATVRRSYSALKQIYPELEGLPIARTWAGYIDGTPDGLPVLSRVRDVEGLVVGAGFSGHGFGLAPASGQALADLASGESLRHDIGAFGFERFSTGAYTAATTVAR